MATKRAPKRAYSVDYLKFGFTSIIIGGIEKPQCVLCLKVLSAESMNRFNLKDTLGKNIQLTMTEIFLSSNDNLNLPRNLDLIQQDRQQSL